MRGDFTFKEHEVSLCHPAEINDTKHQSLLFVVLTGM